MFHVNIHELGGALKRLTVTVWGNMGTGATSPLDTALALAPFTWYSEEACQTLTSGICF